MEVAATAGWGRAHALTELVNALLAERSNLQAQTRELRILARRTRARRDALVAQLPAEVRSQCDFVDDNSAASMAVRDAENARAREEWRRTGQVMLGMPSFDKMAMEQQQLTAEVARLREIVGI